MYIISINIIGVVIFFAQFIPLRLYLCQLFSSTCKTVHVNLFYVVVRFDGAYILENRFVVQLWPVIFSLFAALRGIRTNRFEDGCLERNGMCTGVFD